MVSATLWIDTAAERTVDLGNTLQMYVAFAEMAKLVNVDDWSDLFGVMTQVELQEDADPQWLADVSLQAGMFLQLYDVSERTRELLEALRDI